MLFILVQGCNQDGIGESDPAGMEHSRIASGYDDVEVPESDPTVIFRSAERRQTETPHAGNQFDIGNTRYLFVLDDHSVDDMRSLLMRADELSQSETGDMDDLEIALVIHGPTVNMFTRNSYQVNQELIDLAEKLDTKRVINFKICDTSLSLQGIEREEIPGFIDSVPFAPDEISRLKGAGYINL